MPGPIHVMRAVHKESLSQQLIVILGAVMAHNSVTIDYKSYGHFAKEYPSERFLQISTQYLTCTNERFFSQAEGN